MNGPAAVRHLLAHDTPLLVQVPATRIAVGILKTGETLPAISLQLISGIERTTVAMTEGRRLRTQRVQVTVHGKTLKQVQTILELVRTAVPNTNGTVNGIHVDSILPEGEGPWFHDPDADIYEGSRDYLVRFHAAS